MTYTAPFPLNVTLPHEDLDKRIKCDWVSPGEHHVVLQHTGLWCWFITNDILYVEPVIGWAATQHRDDLDGPVHHPVIPDGVVDGDPPLYGSRQEAVEAVNGWYARQNHSYVVAY